jgi:hypothetical protein
MEIQCPACREKIQQELEPEQALEGEEMTHRDCVQWVDS